MASTTTQLATAVLALKAQIIAKSETATAEELAYIASAIEKIGGQASVFEVMETAEQAKSDISIAKQAVIDALNAQKDSISDALSEAKDSISDALSEALSEAKDSNINAIGIAATNAMNKINPNNFSIAAVHAAALSI